MEKFKKLLTYFTVYILMVACGQNDKDTFSVERAEKALNHAAQQYELMYQSFEDKSGYPRTTSEEGEVEFVKPRDWTSGFFPGSLWYLYEYTGESIWKDRAETSNAGLEALKNYGGTHDLGFMMYNSFGNGYRLTGNGAYLDILVKGAETLSTRYDSTVGCIKSWDWGDRKGWQFPVIVDNMMNLEYLCWATQQTGDSVFYDIALNHSDKTLKNHFRSDNSSYHVVDYDTITGEAIWHGTHQGYADETAWARGQAWGLYGYTMMYRESKKDVYLQQAVKIADFILNHPNLPEDNVPYWDFNAPDIPNAFRDASAAAINTSALIELSQYVDDEKKQFYFQAAEKTLASLSGETYLAKKGENNNFILMHSVGNLPGESEVDVPINYADYYFIEALMRYISLVE